MPMKDDNSDIKILIVDDIPKNIQIVGSILQKQNYDIYFANDGETAIQQTESKNFDLILLDIMMPVLDGFGVCQLLKSKEKTRNIPIIFLTAKTDAESISTAFEIGGQDYVTKPFHAKELIARVKTQIAIRRQKEQLQVVNKTLEEKVLERTKQLRLANQRLSRLDKAKNDFLLLINHELRTPLNGILGFSKILEENMKTSEYAEFIKLINKSAQKLSELADISLLITSLRSDQYKTKKQTIPLHYFIDEVLENISEKSEDKNITMHNKVTSDNIQISTDKRLMNKCLLLILDNAVKYSPKGGTVEIQSNQIDDKIVIEIIDNGNGFSEQALHQIFELFNSADILYHSEGFGLGLATAKLIMTTLSGDITVENRQTKGAKVKLYIPKN